MSKETLAQVMRAVYRSKNIRSQRDPGSNDDRRSLQVLDENLGWSFSLAQEVAGLLRKVTSYDLHPHRWFFVVCKTVAPLPIENIHFHNK